MSRRERWKGFSRRGWRDPPDALRRGAGEELLPPAFGLFAFFFEAVVQAVALFGGEFGKVGVAGFVAVERGDFDGAEGYDAMAADDADVLSGHSVLEAGAEVFLGFGDREQLGEAVGAGDQLVPRFRAGCSARLLRGHHRYADRCRCVGRVPVLTNFFSR